MQSGLNENRVDDGKRFRDSVLYTFLFLLLLWGIRITEYYLKEDFGELGILPRTAEGSLGIFTGPLIHGDFYHLISNTFPLAILGIGVIYFYRQVAHLVIGIIYLVSGLAVWLIARDAYHIGASGIVYGMMFFLLTSGFIRNDRRQLAISFVILLLYGGSMFSGLLPTDSSVSWEAHGMGALAGVFSALLFRKTYVPTVQDLNDELEETPSIDYTGEAEFYYKIKYKDKEDME